MLSKNVIIQTNNLHLWLFHSNKESQIVHLKIYRFYELCWSRNPFIAPLNHNSNNLFQFKFLLLFHKLLIWCTKNSQANQKDSRVPKWISPFISLIALFHYVLACWYNTKYLYWAGYRSRHHTNDRPGVTNSSSMMMLK